jgi:ABC-type uncharacterized transport system auxiliary subunit
MMRANRKMKMPLFASRQTRSRLGDCSMIVRGAICLVAISAGLLTGCGAAPRSKYYQLTVPNRVAEAPSSDTSVKLLIGSLSASHLYREDGIVYSHGPGQLGTYQYQRWAEPPTDMVGEVFLRELRANGRYLAVQPQRSNTSGDFVIRGRLHDFKEVDGSSMLARVTFELEMRDLKTGATVWTHYYTHDEPVSGKDVPAVVAAMDKNVQQGVKEVVASLDQYFASHPVK